MNCTTKIPFRVLKAYISDFKAWNPNISGDFNPRKEKGWKIFLKENKIKSSCFTPFYVPWVDSIFLVGCFDSRDYNKLLKMSFMENLDWADYRNVLAKSMQEYDKLVKKLKGSLS